MKHWMGFVALGLAISGCGSDQGGTSDDQSSVYGALPPVNCNDGEATPTYADVSAGIFAKCDTCHGSTVRGGDRQDAPSDVAFDVESDAKSRAEQAAALVFQGVMPAASRTAAVTVTDDEKEALYRWALCGTP